MSDVPLGPGFPNPFGFDLEQLMRMLQSEGPVNLDMARQVATAVATADPETGQSTTEPAIDGATRATFDDVVRAAQVTVAETTGIPGTLGIASVCVDRAGWAHATIEGLVPVFNALAGALRSLITNGTERERLREGAWRIGNILPMWSDAADRFANALAKV